MKKTVIILIIITFFSTIVGLIRDLILSFTYGVSYITDIYLISMTIPQTISAFIGAAISSIFIPLYKKIEQRDSLQNANKFTLNLINLLFTANTIIVLIVILYAPFFVRIFASGFDKDMLNLTVLFLRITAASIYFSTLVILFSNYLQIKNKFAIAGLASIPLNLLIIFFIIVSAKINIYYLAYGFLISSFFQTLFFIPYIKKAGLKYSFTRTFKDKHIKEFLLLSLPVIGGVSIYQINNIIDMTLASQVMIGGISMLMYANKVSALVYGLLVVPIATAIYPKFSQLSAEGNISTLKDILSKVLIMMILMVIPTVAAILLYSETIIEILYGRGAFDKNAIVLTSSVLIYYSFGLLGSSMREITYRVYYSLQDTKTPLINSAVAMLLNVLLSVVLSKYMGLSGIALGTSIASIVSSILLLNGLKSKIEFNFYQIAWKSTFKIILSTLITFQGSYIIYNKLNNILDIYLAFPISVIGSIIFYLIIISKMKIDEFDEINKSIVLKMLEMKSRRN